MDFWCRWIRGYMSLLKKTYFSGVTYNHVFTDTKSQYLYIMTLIFSDMAESQIQFGRHLECPICMERYSPQERIPKVLPCGHTFCNICLENVASRQRLECPNCKVIHKVPSQGVQGFITNYDTLRMLDYSCEECFKYGQTSRCTHCSKMLCSSCRESHKGELQKSVNIPDMDLAGLSQLPSDIPDMDLARLSQLPSDIPDMDLAGLSIATGETASAPVVSIDA